ncbi:TonB family protein [Sphingomicrobium astaxanthinifaciens]|uniref:TonB family protein n=1 Tax=Sphingomicrobium astaxanthinifaciens TaxID=1227949 RepID=UPI001FCBBDC7|nr:TonB family protein [Sphingomicrobium astaxanthinifaciens]MCJ7420891.1 energy transducer TonB [Sphingomicrobium astaxanthinifaciens]
MTIANLLLLLTAVQAQPPAPEAVNRTMEFIAARPEEAMVLGHYGRLTVRSRIAEGGQLNDLRVAKSSGSDLLDAATLADLEGGSVRGSEVGDIVDIEVDYLPFDQDNIREYSCRQATRDLTWWQSLSDQNTPRNSSIYRMLSGLLLIGTIDHGSPQKQAARYKAFGAHFATSIERCRARPDASFLTTAVTAD